MDGFWLNNSLFTSFTILFVLYFVCRQCVYFFHFVRCCNAYLPLSWHSISINNKIKNEFDGDKTNEISFINIRNKKFKEKKTILLLLSITIQKYGSKMQVYLCVCIEAKSTLSNHDGFYVNLFILVAFFIIIFFFIYSLFFF